MKNIILSVLFFVFANNIFSQDLQSYIDDFDNIVKETPTKIYNTDRCYYLINKLNTLNENLKQVLNNSEQIHPDDIKVLKWTKVHAEALEDFLRTVGNSGKAAMYMTENQLSLVQDLFSVGITEVYSQKFCCSLFEIKFDNYICLLAFKKGGDEIYNIKSKISAKSGLSTSSMDMGLIVNKYRRLWSNGDDLTIKSYQILSIQCTLTGHNSFGL